MQNLKRTLCLMLALILAALSGCGIGGKADPPLPVLQLSEVLDPQNRRVKTTVAEVEQAVNTALAELGYPLEIRFPQPDERGYSQGQ